MAVFTVSGKWKIQQTNGFTVEFNLQQNGRSLGGSAAVQGGASGTIREGQVTDTQFFVIVDWPGEHDGEYHGTFGPNGRLTGQTFDLADRNSHAGWFSLKQFGPQL